MKLNVGTPVSVWPELSFKAHPVPTGQHGPADLTMVSDKNNRRGLLQALDGGPYLINCFYHRM